MAERVRVAAAVEARGLDLHVEVPAGRTVALVGPNGAGKSSLVQLIAGGLLPSAGEVAVGDATVSRAGRAEPIHRRRVGFLEQRALLFPHLSVLDNVAYGPRSRGVARAAARARAEQELAAVGLEGFGARRPRELSGGQAQRVALARALAVDPDVMLLDEPFAALDATVAPELRRLLRERLRGLTTILVTHDFLDVVAMADQLIELDAGRVVAAGAVDDLCQSPRTEFLAGFVGLNLLRGEPVGDDAVAVGDGVVVTGVPAEPLGGGSARAVFQPSAVSIFRDAPHGSPRNALPARVLTVEDRWPVQRVTIEVAGQRVAADLTPAAVRELGLGPGERVVAVLKATQVALHPNP